MIWLRSPDQHEFDVDYLSLEGFVKLLSALVLDVIGFSAAKEGRDGSFGING
jgi:hypothetical protein